MGIHMNGGSFQVYVDSRKPREVGANVTRGEVNPR
jgi:hypothetical protein